MGPLCAERLRRLAARLRRPHLAALLVVPARVPDARFDEAVARAAATLEWPAPDPRVLDLPTRATVELAVTCLGVGEVVIAMPEEAAEGLSDAVGTYRALVATLARTGTPEPAVLGVVVDPEGRATARWTAAGGSSAPTVGQPSPVVASLFGGLEG